MLIVMENTATQAEIENVCSAITAMGFESHKMPGVQRTAICITGNNGAIADRNFSGLPGIREVIRVSKPYKLASNETKHEPTIVQVGSEKFGGGHFSVISGPCSVEDEDTTLRIAEKLKKAGIKIFRAGAYKPRTSPYSFQGQAEKGLRILERVKREFGMPIVTEVMDSETLPGIVEVADVLQVGARNMQNFSLLKSLGKTRTPVLLKRGMSATMDELLMSAEYVMAGGNRDVILCERGIKTFANHSRNTLDITIVPALQTKTHLPIIIDPSHAAGLTYMVAPLMRAAAAVGCDGIIVESHDNPSMAWSDGAQAILPEDLPALLQQMSVIRGSFS